MATPFLPSTGSIVDYLKTKNQDSSPTARRKLYNDLGFSNRLGDYVGSPSQNMALLKHLQTQSDKVTPTAQSTVATFGVVPSDTSTFQNQPFTTQSSTRPTAPGIATSVLDNAGLKPPVPPTASSVIQKPKNFLNQTPAPTPAPAPAPAPTKTLEQKPTAQPKTYTTPSGAVVDEKGNLISAPPGLTESNDLAKKMTGIAASDIYPDIFGSSTKSEVDLVNDWLTSPEGKLFMDKQNLTATTNEATAEAAKQVLESKYESEKTSLEEKLAANGLAFSGVRGTQIKALADSLATSQLGIDRELASKLLDADMDLRDAILDGVADLTKQAADGRKEAIDQLNEAGFAVVGGQLVPTLSAQREERALRSEERSNIQLDMSERRLQLAEEASARAEARFEEQYGAGKKDQFAYVNELMSLNPNASRAELKAAALENTSLTSTEIDAVLDTIGLTDLQQVAAAKTLVASAFTKKFWSGRASELEAAKEAAKKTIRNSGGVLKINNRVVSLSEDQIAALEAFIDTVTADEALEVKKTLEK